MKTSLFGALLCTVALDASASCGAAFCLVNTDWSAQGGMTDEGLRLDLRGETVDLDRPRNGRSTVSVGAIARDHDEVETRNRNAVAALDWNFAPEWGATLSLPYVDRQHTHIHNGEDVKALEKWSFRDLGDVRLQGRYVEGTTAEDASRMRAWGFTFGVKLPTGRHDVKNGDGEAAERTLQPGTGTTDALLGVFLHGAAPLAGWSWFTRAGLTLPMTTRDEYRPAKQLQLDAGVRYAASTAVGVMLQVNGNFRGRDSGANAEPEDSGQREVFVSPGVSWNATRDTQLYAFVQVPVYQAVNGVQLTARWSALAGVSLRF